MISKSMNIGQIKPRNKLAANVEDDSDDDKMNVSAEVEPNQNKLDARASVNDLSTVKHSYNDFNNKLHHSVQKNNNFNFIFSQETVITQ